MSEEKLTLKSEAKGFDETAKKVDTVADAQDRLKGAVKKTAEPTRDAAAAQDKLNASESDFIGLLTQVAPGMGRFADAMIKGLKIAGDLSTQELKLGEIIAKTTGFIKANAGAFKLLLAGGAVAAGFAAIAAAMGKVREESERVEKQLRKQKEAQDALRESQLDQQGAIERLASTRREGGFTADESRRSQTTAARVKKQFEFLDDSSINQAAAFGGADRSADEVARIAALVQSGRLNLDGQRGQASQDRLIERELRRFSDFLQNEFKREIDQGQTIGATGERADRARVQAVAQPGSSATELRKIAEQFATDTEEAENLARIIQEAGGTLAGLNELGARAILGDAALSESGKKRLLTQEDAQAADVLRAQARPIIVTINQQHSKHVGPDAFSQRRGMINGEIMSRARGER